MRFFNYRAILTKQFIMQGKVTYTDNRTSNGTISLPLDSQCVVGVVLAENNEKAKEYAIVDVQKMYPAERGYSNYDNVAIEEQEG